MRESRKMVQVNHANERMILRLFLFQHELRNVIFTMRSAASAQYQEGEQSNPFDGEAMEMDHTQPV